MKAEQVVSAEEASAISAWHMELRLILQSSKGKVVLVGMGHPLRSDDYAGSYLAKRLILRTRSKGFKNFHIFNGEDNVEALIMQIAKLEPEHVIFVDACEMKAKPAEMQLISVAQTSYPFFTTHGVPLKLLAEQLLPKSKVWLLAIQPKNTDFGEHLSSEIRAAVESVSDYFEEVLQETSRD